MPTHNGWQIRAEGSDEGVRITIFEPTRGLWAGQILVDAYYKEEDSEGLMVSVVDNANPKEKGYLYQFEFGKDFIYGVKNEQE